MRDQGAREESQEQEVEAVDPIQRLAIDGAFLPVVSNLLSFLDPVDLARASCVSRTWHRVISSDPRARVRREAYVRDMRYLRSSVGQENWPMKQPDHVMPPVRQPFRDLRCHQQPVRQFPQTPSSNVVDCMIDEMEEDGDDDVFCKESHASKSRSVIHSSSSSNRRTGNASQSVGRLTSRSRVLAHQHRSSVDSFATPQFKSIRLIACDAAGDTGSLIKQQHSVNNSHNIINHSIGHMMHPASQQKQHVHPQSFAGMRSASCSKVVPGVSRRLLIDEDCHRRLSLAGSRSSKKNLKRL